MKAFTELVESENYYHGRLQSNSYGDGKDNLDKWRKEAVDKYISWHLANNEVTSGRTKVEEKIGMLKRDTELSQQLSREKIKGYQDILDNRHWTLPACQDYDKSKTPKIIDRYLNDCYQYVRQAYTSSATYTKLKKSPDFNMLLSDYQESIFEYTNAEHTFLFTSLILTEYVKTLTKSQRKSIRRKLVDKKNTNIWNQIGDNTEIQGKTLEMILSILENH